uniref:Uncharacterized protein n=1 Tax=Plectus sambesii TaxID=2011161 RepID=A0A914WZT7_9BILA
MMRSKKRQSVVANRARIDRKGGKRLGGRPWEIKRMMRSKKRQSVVANPARIDRKGGKRLGGRPQFLVEGGRLDDERARGGDGRCQPPTSAFARWSGRARKLARREDGDDEKRGVYSARGLANALPYRLVPDEWDWTAERRT